MTKRTKARRSRQGRGPAGAPGAPAGNSTRVQAGVADTGGRHASAAGPEPSDAAAPAAHTNALLAKTSILMAGLCLVATLGLILLTPIHNYDIWWHLSVGHWMTTHHSLYTTELFTYPLAGQEVINKWGWLCEVLMDLVHRAGGLVGLILLRLLIVSVIVWRLWKIGTHLLGRSSFWVGITLTAAVWLAAGRLMMRPYLLQYALAVICVELLMRAKASGRWRSLIAVPLLQLIAINTSQSGLVCLAVAGLFFVGELLESLPRAAWKKREKQGRLLAFGLTTLGCLGASVISPVGAAVLPVIEYASPGKSPWHASGVLKIGEWMSPFAAEAKSSGLTWFLVLCLIGAATVTLWRLSKARVTFLLLLVSSGVLGLQYVRHTLLMATIGAIGLMAYLPPRDRRVSPAMAWLLPLTVVGVGLLAHSEYTVIVQPWQSIRAGLDERLIEARAAAQAVVTRNPAARAFNTMGLGGALTWFSGDRIRNFTDGRLINQKNLEEHNTIYFGPEERRRQLIESYGIDVLVLDVRPPEASGEGSLHWELAFGEGVVDRWEPLYTGNHVVAFARRTPANDH